MTRYAWRRVALGTIFILAGLLRIAATYPVFNQVYDEPFTISCGMEWLDQHVYRHDPKHPPLGRVLAALPLYLSGKRGAGEHDPRVEGTALLGTGREYWRNLGSARAALLPFFVLACIVVWRWAAWAAGAGAGLLAVFVFTNLPAVLGNAGLAMTDMPLASAVAAALLLFCLWLEKPGIRRAVLLGLACGLAVLCKFTSLVFLGFSCPALLVLFVWLGKAEKQIAQRLKGVAVAVFCASLLVWAGYRFSFHSFGVEKAAAHLSGFDVPDWNPPAPVTAQENLAGYLRYKAQVLPVPAPELLVGLGQLWRHNHEPEPNYFLGEASYRGWFYFYPIILAVKTPLSILLLCAAGLAVTRRPDWRKLSACAVFAAVLTAGLLSHVNTGIRHVLVVYLPLSVLTAMAGVALARSSKGGLFATLCAAGLLVESGLAHPDYMAWFNAAVDGKSGEFGVDTDLDYGQDLARLVQECERRGVRGLKLSYHGTAAPEALGLTSYEKLLPGTPQTGWVAISIYHQKLSGSGFAWLEEYEPVVIAGSSIRLYHIPAKQESNPS